MNSITTSCLLAAVLGLASLPATAHEEGTSSDPASGPPLILGVLDFPNSGAAAAQDAFARGVLLLHSFEYEDARAAFLEAQRIDPGFALAFWGEAMTFNHPLWMQQDRDEALKVLARLPPAGQRATTPREERFLAAVTALYDPGRNPPRDKPARDQAYRDAMRAAHEADPDDLEAATFYALSLLGSVYERDFRVYVEAAAILEEVFAKQPRHPGAAHYLIHSYDDPVHAPLGLRPARVYATIAPSASHAQHMVSHIYTSLGRWDEVVAANRTAVRVSEEALQRAGKPVAHRSKHALHWLEYALLQQGLDEDARDTLRVMDADYREVPDYLNTIHHVMMRASYVADDPRGDLLLQPIEMSAYPLWARALGHFATAFRALSEGRPEVARAEHEGLKQAIAGARVLSVEEGLHEDPSASSPDAHLIATIIARQIEALLWHAAGETDAALALLAEAAADENARPLEYGPPAVPKPSSELLGEWLLEQGRAEEAIAEFQVSLSRNTGRTRSLIGLARAQQAAGREAESRETWLKLRSQWKGDPGALAG